MNRRDFLRWGAGANRVLDVSCETLYMNYLVSRLQGTTGRFLERLSRELQSARTVRLHAAFWLDGDELKEALEPCLTELRAAGRVVEVI